MRLRAITHSGAQQVEFKRHCYLNLSVNISCDNG